jgi:ABC-2 type transport system permease protein
MRTLKVLFKTELLLCIRQFDGILFGILFPAGIALLIGFIYRDQAAEGAGYTMMQVSFAALVTVGICATGLMGIPLSIADYRHKKILKRFKVTPTSPMKLLVAQGLVQMFTALVSSFLIFVIVKGIFGFQMIGSPINFIAAYFLVMIMIYSMGMLVASLAPNIKMANVICTLLYFPMLFLSGATVPYEIMPKGLQIAANIFPLTQGIKLLKAVVLGVPAQDFRVQLMVMIALSVVGILISIKCFKWE